MSKALHEVPAKPRGLEATTIERTKLIKLLKDERTRQAKRASKMKRAHQKKVVAILTKALRQAKDGELPGESLYGEKWVLKLPQPPVFSPCNYDTTIHQMENDDRDWITLSASQWVSFFPCDIDPYEEDGDE